MAATQTVSDPSFFRNSRDSLGSTQIPGSPPETVVPRHGVVTLFGYGIVARVDRGHLIVEDGIGAARRVARFPRVRHGLERLVVIGSDGVVSLAALRWLADQDAAFVMLDRDGSVLATTGPVRPSDSRLRRAQALASHSGAALQIARKLLNQKLSGQEQLAHDVLKDSSAVNAIALAGSALATAETISAICFFEAKAAAAYWSAWRAIPVSYPKADLGRVPDHWRTFGTRHSPLTGSSRLAVNPANAILNYLYAMLETETRLAITALGLDPGLGFWHVDTDARDSLACDLMEPVRPQVDAYLLDWITREPLRREWFFEQRDGSCRLTAPLAVRLSETALAWNRAVAPFAEWVSQTLWKSIRKPTCDAGPATRLTQRRKREAKGSPGLPATAPPRSPRVCRVCGASITGGRYCRSCAPAVSRDNLINVAKQGRVAAHTAKAEALRSRTQRRHAAARKAWKPSDKPQWLDERAYREQIQPRLAALTVPDISAALGVSEPYATHIRAGRRRPHPRHWEGLARLVGVAEA